MAPELCQLVSLPFAPSLRLVLLTCNYGAIQYCDCNVSVGSHDYAAQLSREDEGTADPYELNTSVNVVEALDDPKDAGPVPPDAMPWDIPDPVAVQGLDCASACAHPSPTDAGAGSTAGSNKIGKDGGGCSLARHRAGTGTLMIGLCLLLGFGFRAQTSNPDYHRSSLSASSAMVLAPWLLAGQPTLLLAS
jgi:hypothetical protein